MDVVRTALFVGVWACAGVKGELYTSLTLTQNLFTLDESIGTVLALAPSLTPPMERYLEAYKGVLADRGVSGGSLSPHITANPLHIYAVVKRLVLEWPEISRQLYNEVHAAASCQDTKAECVEWGERAECYSFREYMADHCKYSCDLCPSKAFLDSMAQLRHLESSTLLPTREDLGGTARALSRLRRVYRLKVTHMAEGRMMHRSSSVRLDVFDCIRVANETHHEPDLPSSWLWYLHCHSMTSDPYLQDLIAGLMEPVKREHDADFRDDSTDHFGHRLSAYREQLPKDSVYAQLCRGEYVNTDPRLLTLKCQLTSRNSPYLVLQPLKAEQLHYDPEMWLFYDVLNDEEISSIQQVARSKLERSATLAEKTYSDLRVSQTAWLKNTSHPVLQRKARQVMHATGLLTFEGEDGTRAAEDLQVLSYGVGGHYIYHCDTLYKFLPEHEWNQTSAGPGVLLDGERVVTWMYYLSDVESGGRTAFPRAGVSVPPVRGSAVMWYNVYRNGSENTRAEHGGCPVLLGHKWVANKWIRENANFLRIPCTTDPLE